jgi:AraC-like DNA-binding protein
MSQEFLKNLDIDKIEKEAFAIHLKVGAFATTWHQHRPHQLLYAESGVLHLKTEQETFILPARFGAWIPSQVHHQVYSSSPGLFLRTLYFQKHKRDAPFFKSLRVFAISDLAREMILKTESWGIDGKSDEVATTFFAAIRQLAPEWGENKLPVLLPIPDHPRLREVTEYLRENLAEPVQISATALRFGFSDRTLMRLFQKELGMTFSNYLKVARISRALELLASPGAFVTETAFAVGYESLGSFSDAFYQLVRMRPSHYLKALSK